MTIEIRDDRARDFSLYLKRMTYEDAYRRTDCGYTAEGRKSQAYRFLEGATSVETSLNEQIYQQSLKRKKEEQSQGFTR